MKQRILDILKNIGKKDRRKGSAVNISDLQMPRCSFDSGPAGKDKRWLLKRISLLQRKIQQKRRLKKESYVSPARVVAMKRKLRPYILAALAVVLFAAVDGPLRIGYMLKDISMFKVRSLSVNGCRAVPVRDIVGLSGITLYKTSLLELDVEAIRERLEQEAWIRQATVARNWPSEVVVEVTEHSPVALVNMNTAEAPELHYVDRNGNPFLRVGPGEDFDYPVITGLYEVADAAVRAEIFREIMEFLKRAARNNPNLPEQSVSEVHINRRGEMVVYLVDHPFPIFFGKGDIVAKFYRLLHVMESLYREKKSEALLSSVEYIRMDYFNDKVLVAQSGSG